MFSNPCLFSNDMLAKAQTTFLWFPVFQPSSRRICFILKNDHQNLKKFKDSDHHELLDLVQSVEVSSPLQELAGGDEVAAAWFQARVKFFHYPLQRAKTPPLETGLQHTLEKHLIWALLRHAEKSRRQFKKHMSYKTCRGTCSSGSISVLVIRSIHCCSFSLLKGLINLQLVPLDLSCALLSHWKGKQV